MIEEKFATNDSQSNNVEALDSSLVLLEMNKVRHILQQVYGPDGKTMLLGDTKYPYVTKDGIKILDEYISLNPGNFIAPLIRQACLNTVKKAGDGTTGTGLLCAELYKTFKENKLFTSETLETVIKKIEDHENNVNFDKKQLTSFLDSILNNKKLAGSMSELIDVVRKRGFINYRIHDSFGETTVDIQDGMALEIKPTRIRLERYTKFKTLPSIEFGLTIGEATLVLVNEELETNEDCDKFIASQKKEGKPIIVLCKDIRGTAAGWLDKKFKTWKDVFVHRLDFYDFQYDDLTNDLSIKLGINPAVFKKEKNSNFSTEIKNVSITEQYLMFKPEVEMPMNSLMIEKIEYINDFLTKIPFEHPAYRYYMAKSSIYSACTGVVNIYEEYGAEKKNVCDKVEDAIYMLRTIDKYGVVDQSLLQIIENTIVHKLYENIKANSYFGIRTNVNKTLLANADMIHSSGIDPNLFPFSKYVLLLQLKNALHFTNTLMNVYGRIQFINDNNNNNRSW